MSQPARSGRDILDPSMSQWASPIPLTGNEMMELLAVLGKRLAEIEARLGRIEAQLEGIAEHLAGKEPASK